MAQMILRSTDKLETYIREIEKQEQRQKRRKLLVIGGLFLTVAGVAAATALSLAGAGAESSAQPSFRQIAAGGISIYEVDSLLDTERTPFILVQPDGHMDTVRSLKDFLQLTAAYAPDGSGNAFAPVADDAFSFAGDVENIEVQPSAPAAETPASRVEIRPYSFAIEGSRIAGEPVMVTIIDFDENLSYVLDLGNGLRQRASQRNTFVYPAAGSYEIRLIASHPSGSSSLYRRKVDILPVPVSAPTPSEKAPSSAGARIATNDLKPLDTRRSASLSVVQPAPPTAAPAPVPASENNAVLFSAEIMPAFPGGEEQMRKFISNNVSYPARALSANVQGRVIVRFVVRSDGSISDVAVMKGIGYGCDEEAVRVVRSMPRWNPGIHEGRQVAVQRSLSIQFVAINN